MNIIYENIVKLCEEKGISGGKLCTDLNMSKSTLTDLKKGRQSGISATKAQKIASYFDVSVGFLLGEDEKEEVKSEFSIKKKLFIQKVEAMTDEQIDRLEQIYELMKQK